MFDLSAYLARIGAAPEAPSARALAALQAAQMRAIPFENIDVLLGAVPDLDPDALATKLVDQRRGGYCLELNGLFGRALAALGYPVRPVLGRVRMGAAQGGPRAHLAHVVSVGGRRFLADTGFGGPGASVPLDIDARTAIETPLGVYRLRVDAASGERVLERREQEAWFALWSFDDVAVQPPDVIAANVVCARWDGAPFPAHLMASVLRGAGRASLFDLTLSLDGARRTLASRAELAAALSEVFGLTLDTARVAAVWSRLAPAARAAA